MNLVAAVLLWVKILSLFEGKCFEPWTLTPCIVIETFKVLKHGLGYLALTLIHRTTFSRQVSICVYRGAPSLFV